MKFPTLNLSPMRGPSPLPVDMVRGERDVPWTADLRSLNEATSAPPVPSMRLVQIERAS